MSRSTAVASRSRRTTVQAAALAVGVVFLAIGILGFVPGITTNYDSLAAWSQHSQALLFGLFQVSILHNIVHLVFGVAGVLMARTAADARSYLVVGGAIYLVLFVYGLIVASDSPANFVPINPADDILHLVLGLAMIALGLSLRHRSSRARR